MKKAQTKYVPQRDFGHFCCDIWNKFANFDFDETSLKIQTYGLFIQYSFKHDECSAIWMVKLECVWHVCLQNLSGEQYILRIYIVIEPFRRISVCSRVNKCLVGWVIMLILYNPRIKKREPAHGQAGETFADFRLVHWLVSCPYTWRSDKRFAN